MKLTEIVWETGRRYEDNYGYIWEVNSDGGTLSGEIDFNESYLESFYSLREISELEFKGIVNWSQVKVDTKVTVWNTDFDSFKRKRYFAKYEDGLIYVFGDGRTSWNALDENDLTAWDCGELAE